MLHAFILTLGLYAALLPASAMAESVKNLPGYSNVTVSDIFAEYLEENDHMVAILAKDQDLSRLVMSRAALQNRLMQNKTTLEKLAATYFPHRAVKVTTTAMTNNTERSADLK